MDYKEFTNWLDTIFREQLRYKDGTATYEFSPDYFDSKTGKQFGNLDEVAAAFERGENVTVSYKNALEEKKNVTVNKADIEKRLKTIGLYEGDSKYYKQNPNNKNAYKGVKKFSDKEKFNMLFNSEYDRLHEIAHDIAERNNQRVKLEKKFPRPKEASEEIFTRGYNLYLDYSGTEEAERNNYRLMESLRTPAGRKAFITRAIKDVLSSDFEDILKSRGLEEGLDYYDKHTSQVELLWIVPNLVTVFGKNGYEITPELKSVLKDFDVLAQGAGIYRTYLDAMSPDYYYMLPGLDYKSTQKMMVDSSLPKNLIPQGMKLFSYFGGSEMSKAEQEALQKFVDVGGMSPFVKLTDENGNPLTKQDAVRFFQEGETVNVTPMTDEEKKLLQEQIEEPFEFAERRFNEQRAIDHARELDNMGAVGQLRKELEFQQLKLGDINLAEGSRSIEYYKDVMARILATAQVIDQVEKIQEQLKDSPDELKDIIETMTNPDQIAARTEMLKNSSAYQSFLENSSETDLMHFAIREENGGLSADNYEELREVASLVEREMSVRAADEFREAQTKEAAEAAAKAAQELAEAKEWYKSLGEELTKQGLDLNNPYTMGLLRVNHAPATDITLINPADYTKEQLIDIAKANSESTVYALMERTGSGDYKVAPPDSREERLEWIKQNLKTYSTASDEMIRKLYHEAKDNKLMLREPGTETDWQRPPHLIKIGQGGKATVTPRITELLDSAMADTKDRLNNLQKQYGLTDADMQGIGDTARTMMSRNFAYSDLEAKLDSKDLQREVELLAANNAAEKAVISTGILHPEWLDDAKLAEGIWLGAQVGSVNPYFQTDEDKELLKNVNSPGQEVYDTEKNLLKMTGAKDIAEVMNSGVVTRVDGSPYEFDNTLDFLCAVTEDSMKGAIMVEAPNKKTGVIENVAYVKLLDMGLQKAVFAASYTDPLKAIQLTAPEESIPEFDELQQALDRVAKLKSSYGEINNVFGPVKNVMSAAKNYREAMSNRDNLSAGEMENLKSLTQIELIGQAVENRKLIAKVDPLKQLATKMACEQAEMLMSAKGQLNVPGMGKMDAKEYGKRMLTDPDAMNLAVNRMMKQPAFQKCFGGKSVETTQMLLQYNVKDLFEAFSEVSKAFAAEKTGPNLEQNAPKHDAPKNENPEKSSPDAQKTM